MGFLTRVPPVLLFGLAAWTFFTFGVGWYALQGTSRASGHADHGNRRPPTVAAVAASGVTGTPTLDPTRAAAGSTVLKTSTPGTARTAIASPRASTTPPVTTTRSATRTAAGTPRASTTATPRSSGTALATRERGTRTVPAGEFTQTPEQPSPTPSPTAVATFTPTTVVHTGPSATPTIRPRPVRPTATVTPAPYPVPRYAQSAGVEGGVAGAGGGSSAVFRDAAHAPNKGVVVLDPGHGRGDPGAVHHLPDGTPDVLEAEVNLRNAQMIRTELLALGYDVYLTRDGPGRGPDGPLVQQFIVSDLIWRTQLATAVDADLFLALHGNGASVKSIAGPETWYCGQHAQGSANATFAAMIQQAMMDALHEYGYFPPNRGIMEDAERHHSGDFCQFVVTRDTIMPSALLEFLFLSNDDDARVLADVRSQEILAIHVAAAIDRFLSDRP